MAAWPAGEVTFLFIDLVGSTVLWECYPEQMPHAYEIHDAALRTAAEAAGGIVYKAIGDAFQVAFADPAAARAAPPSSPSPGRRGRRPARSRSGWRSTAARRHRRTATTEPRT